MADEYIKREDAIKAVDNLCHVYFPANKANLEAKDTELENAIAALTKTHNDDKTALESKDAELAEAIAANAAAIALFEEISDEEISNLFACVNNSISAVIL